MFNSKKSNFVKSVSVRSLVDFYTNNDKSSKAFYTNPALISVGNALIKRGLGDKHILIEFQSGITPNRGTFGEVATAMLVADYANTIGVGNDFKKAQKSETDLDVSMLPLAIKRRLGLNVKGGKIEIKYANSNSKASEIENPDTTIVLLLTQNGYSLVKRENLITDPKTGKIFAKSEKNGVTCHTLNKLAGFERAD